MLSKSFPIIVAAAATVSAYDVGCLWPSEALGDAFSARLRLVQTSFQDEYSTETPQVVHIAHKITVCQATCNAYHTPGYLDPLTREPTLFTVPEFGQNPFSTLMCLSQCFIHAVPKEFQANAVVAQGETSGFDVTLPEERQDIADALAACPTEQKSCADNCAAACAIVEQEGYNPYVVGHFVGVMIADYMSRDGWNSQGTMQYDRNTNETVPCTGSCRKYQDTTGYHPQPDPRFFTELSEDNTKYECTGLCRRWQPLQEGNDVGDLVQQEAIAPHVGFKANTYLREATLTLEDPGYDLYQDSLQVIEEVKITSGDELRKNEVRFFDNKIGVRGMIQAAVTSQLASDGSMSFQEFLVYLVGMSTAEHDGLVQAWKEKVAHDLVRPTTVIKHWDDDLLFTFGGNRNANGPVEIAARDFEAFIRVMPHGEYPSGSSCLCTAYMEFTDVFLTEMYGRTITNIRPNGFNRIYANMTEVRDICGESRIWGGMHYPAAVPAGVQVCAGLGTLGSEYAKTLLNNVTLANPWYRGDGRPICNEN